MLEIFPMYIKALRISVIVRHKLSLQVRSLQCMCLLASIHMNMHMVRTDGSRNSQ